VYIGLFKRVSEYLQQLRFNNVQFAVADIIESLSPFVCIAWLSDVQLAQASAEASRLNKDAKVGATTTHLHPR
jgi:hypothetical protein